MEKTNKNVKKNIDDKTIRNEIVAIAKDCYGIFDVEEQQNISDLKIKKGNEEAVFIRRHADSSYTIDVYLILASDIKITEILRSTQKTIKYSLEKKFGISVRQLNVFAESIASNN